MTNSVSIVKREQLAVNSMAIVTVAVKMVGLIHIVCKAAISSVNHANNPIATAVLNVQRIVMAKAVGGIFLHVIYFVQQNV